MKVRARLRNLGCQALLYLRAPGNLWCFYLDPNGENFSGTPGIIFFEGLCIFSVIYSPLILVTRHVTDIGWFTYPALVLLSTAIYAIPFIDKFERLTRLQHDHGCWFPKYFLRNGYVKVAVGLIFLVIQAAVFGTLMVAYLSSYGSP